VTQVVVHGARPELPEDLEVPEDLRALMEQCWSQNPLDRPTAAQVCAKLKAGGRRVFKNGRLLKLTGDRWQRRECILGEDSLQYYSEGRAEGETPFLKQLVQLEEEEVSMAAAMQTGGGGRRSLKLKPHAFMLVSADGTRVLLAAETAEVKEGWIDMLRGFMRRSFEAFVTRGDGACKWLVVDDEFEMQARGAGLREAQGGRAARLQERADAQVYERQVAAA
jgi:hypothetical protein